ncbi:MAG TPA: GNAT family N-acetyltransferase [Candidatus Limnocylindrales bacterium]|nr:GNAT family N-acetyltransferase [Candidatus Limnocylindrales bacterium]
MASVAGADPAQLLRPATDADAPAINRLVAAAYSPYIPLIGRTPIPMLTDYAIAVREHDVWVLVADGTIVGALELVAYPDHLWLEDVAILPAWQGRGLGGSLIRHAEDEARRRSLPEIRLLTNERYEADIAIYTHYGYRETHRRPHLGTDLVYFAKAIGLSDQAGAAASDGHIE